MSSLDLLSVLFSTELLPDFFLSFNDTGDIYKSILNYHYLINFFLVMKKKMQHGKKFRGQVIDCTISNCNVVATR